MQSCQTSTGLSLPRLRQLCPEATASEVQLTPPLCEEKRLSQSETFAKESHSPVDCKRLVASSTSQVKRQCFTSHTAMKHALRTSPQYIN
eukprot:3258601-Amphidinium_carterae.1